jgi:predicted phage terminase large subunit-like protein
LLNSHQIKEELMIRKIRQRLIHFALGFDDLYDANWHHVYLAAVLERFFFGDIDRLMVWMPPQHGKTQLVNRFGIPWALGRNPSLKIAQASYGDDLATSINIDIQRIMESELYHRIFPQTVIPRNIGVAKNQSNNRELKRRTQKIFELVGQRGSLRSVGVGGPLTGQRADILSLDDPHKDHKDALLPTRRQDVYDWYVTTARTRTHKDSKIAITQTRWHESDLSGTLIEKQKKLIKAGKEIRKPWFVVSFPAIMTVDNKRPGDPRKVGEALWPGLHDLPSLQDVKDDIPESWWNALYQQNPTDVEGSIIKRAWIRHWDELPKNMDNVILSCDLTFDDTEDGDYNVFSVYGKKGPDIYLMDRVREIMGFTEQCDAIRSLKSKHRGIITTLIENKANGAAAINVLKNEFGGIEKVNPREDKAIRLSAVKSWYKNGNIFYPTPERFEWVDDHVTEMVSFPKSKYKDAVDAESQAITYLSGNSFDRLKALSQM